MFARQVGVTMFRRLYFWVALATLTWWALNWGQSRDLEYVGSTPWGVINDVKISGDYAYCAAGGLLVLNISNPANPIWAHQLWAPGGNKLFINSNRVYLARGFYGLDIFDITEPEDPILMGHCDELSHVHDVFVIGSYAYVADDDSGLVVLDISDSHNPIMIGNLATTGTAEGIFVAGIYAYIADGSQCALEIINIENPAFPVRATGFDDSLYSPMNVYIWGAYAFVANFPSDIVIVDVTNPSQPTRASRLWWPIHSRDVCVSGDYAFAICEDFGLEVYDVSNPRTPAHVGNYAMSGFISGLVLFDNRAYVGNNGLQIIDVSQPSQPVRSGQYRAGQGYGVIALADHYAYAAAENNGFDVIDIVAPSSPTVVSSFDSTDTGKQLFIEGNYLFALVDNTHFRGLRIFDISNRQNPVRVGGYSSNYADGEISSNYFYIVEGNSSLEVVDVSNPATPYLAGVYDIQDTVVRDITITGNYAFLTGTYRHRILNISNPTSPSLVGFFYSPTQIRFSYLHEDMLCLAATEDSIYLYDVSHPQSPEPTGTINSRYPASIFGGMKIKDNYLFTYGLTRILKMFDISTPSSPVLADSFSLYATDIAFSGAFVYSVDGGPLFIWRWPLTGTSEEPGERPMAFSLLQNYPNPFNAQTVISYSLPADIAGSLSIYDIAGRLVRTLDIAPGSSHIAWDGLNNAGHPVSSGIYFYAIAGYPDTARKMVLLR